MNALLQKILAATNLTRRGDLVAATAAIQEALSGGGVVAPVAVTPATAPSPSERVQTSEPATALLKGPLAAPDAALGGSGRFLEGRHAGVDGGRAFKLFVPDRGDGSRRPLVVMLHGCQQNPDDFAAGTRMNEHAAAAGFYVLYPTQAPRSNAQRCWNWFQPADQRRGSGEPALIAGIVGQVMAEHPIDADRVFVAGLSAGAAMAAILAHEYADVFAAAGIHSGLPPGAAQDVASAFAAMQSGHARTPRAPAWPGVVAASAGRLPMAAWPQPVAPVDADRDADPGAPLIVFHGDADTTVHPTNGSLVLDAGLGSADWQASRDTAASGRRRSTRMVYTTPGADAQTPSRAEHWIVHGAGHAWAGGSATGSFTDPEGPDATAEMLRFFAEHPRLARRRAFADQSDV